MRRLTRLLMDAVNENVDALPRRLCTSWGCGSTASRRRSSGSSSQEIYYRYYGASLGEIDPLQVIREAFNLVAEMHLRLPTRYALLDKTLATLGDVGVEMYPDFNVFEVAEPYAAELSGAVLAAARWPSAARRRLLGYGAAALELPYQVHDMLEQFRDGEVEVQFRHSGLDQLTSKADVVFNRLVIAIVMAGTIDRRRR